MNNDRYIFSLPIVASTVLAFGSLFSFGQSPTPSPTPGPSVTASPRTGTPATTSPPKRRFEIDTLLIGGRYHFIKNADDRISSNNLQYQLNLRAHFNFDANGRYSLHAGIFTGNVITTTWNNTGIGTGRFVSNIYLKQLYFDARPTNGLEVKIGGFAPDNGESTEVTGYDNDTYMVGERVTIKLPKKLYFDEISATNGYFGDIAVPNVLRRFKRMASSNYHQFMVKKRFNKFVAFSTDYTFDSGVDILRQGIRVTVPKSRLLDLLQFETYERIDPDPGYGLNVYGQKKLNKYFSLGGGYARIDRRMINSDRFLRGNRLYLNAIVTFSKEFNVTTSITEGIGPIQPTLPRTRMDVIFGYNILETLRRKKRH